VLALLAVVGIAGSPALDRGSHWFDLAVPVAVPITAAVAAVIGWLVTRWRLDGVTLRIETGLFRRDSQQLPIARIQAVDVVRPVLARALGLAELRVRLAGSGDDDGRLAYLTEQAAMDLRAYLLAAHHGLDPATPEPAERIAVTVPAGRLIGSVVLSTTGTAGVVVIAGLILSAVSAIGTAAVAGTLVWWLISFVPLAWRRVSAQYGFTVAHSPDGIRIRRGLLGTVAETIPVPRVQAVRMVEPLLWRPVGWCRLEVDVAGSPGREDGGARVRKALLPVGRQDEAAFLLRMVAGCPPPVPARPPRRARVKAPLSYHNLAAGHDDVLAVSVTGRLRRITTLVPLEKAQSVRLVQGPLQRHLGLATVHVDAAGQVRAEFRERPQAQARLLVDELAALSRSARRGVLQAASVVPPVNDAQREA
jgi:putative membrane protein